MRISRTHQENIVPILIVSAAVILFIFNNIFGLIEIKSFGAIVPANIVDSCVSLFKGEFTYSNLLPLTSLITYLFLHGDGSHIVYNMIFFWIFASFVNTYLGKWWLLALFLFTGACAGLLFTVVNQASGTPLIGASGAVSGLEGVFFVFALTTHLKDTHVWPLAAPVTSTRLIGFALAGLSFDLYSVFTNVESNVAFEAHIGGFVSGILAALIIRYAILPARETVGKRKAKAIASQAFHTCKECGIDDKSHPEMSFRYCSKCGKGFCEEHITNHKCE